MPVVFIHGVATRSGEEYERGVAVREELIRRLLIDRMAESDPRWSGMHVTSPYWGDLGVRHYWAQATVPPVSLLEDMGAGGDGATAADLEIAEMLAEMGMDAPTLEGLGGETPLRNAWIKNPHRTVEALLAPVIHSEGSVMRADDLPADRQITPGSAVGHVDGHVLLAGSLAAADADLTAAVRDCVSDDAALTLIGDAIARRAQPPGPGDAEASTLETLGPAWLDELENRVGEVIHRAKNAPARAASIAALDRYRDGLHRHLTLFMGDVFEYLLHRGEPDSPGPIIDRIARAIADVPRSRPDEPLVVLTHSMGGNIFYDLVTSYDPSLKVDLWVSAGGQVGQFEEMKLFKGSTITNSPAPPMPPKVAALDGRVRTWLNVYDPADILSFLIEPVLTDQDPTVRIKDLRFKSGVSALDAHGAYYTRPTFYELLAREVRAQP
ncbi:hypothetical protein [Rhodococcus sp. NPDC058521]|uniref:hypothetical protein n=1 Tax=Rhodococcus sp. NPDC058521 TaxID=3346536 RepID=UPI0036460B3D